MFSKSNGRSGRQLSCIAALLGLLASFSICLTRAQTTLAQTSLQNLFLFSDSFGSSPEAPLVQDSAGNFYGVAYQGGANDIPIQYGFGGYTPGHGTVFELTKAGKLVTLYSFTGGADGSNPQGALAIDSAGNLYGTTYGGGNSSNSYTGDGVVFEIQNPGQSDQTFTVLHTFTRSVDGSGPTSDLALDSAGNIYGSTAFGGDGNHGTLFKITASGTFSTLYIFSSTQASTTGYTPDGGMVLDSAGNLYGTANNGGANGDGTVFELQNPGQSSQIFNLLHTFTGGADGIRPAGDLTWDKSTGTLYGTTITGGGSANDGTVWAIQNAGQSNQTYTVTHAFAGKSDGAEPYGRMVVDSAGSLYGTANSGGANGDGTLFKIQNPGKTTQTFTLLYSFTGGSDGRFPSGGLFRDSQDNLYGATSGTTNNVGGNGDEGTLFKFSSKGVITTVARFTIDGYLPQTTLVKDSKGNLYGVTARGGANNEGEAFKISSLGVLTILHSFDNTDGYIPAASPVLDSKGNLYGTCYYGDASNFGNVWEITSAGKFSILHTFVGGGGDGANPAGLFLYSSTGALYGTTQGWGLGSGTIFEIQNPGKTNQTYQTLHYFNNGNGDGSSAVGALARDSAGNLYGAASYGGANNAGTIFEFTTGGVYKVLYAFTGGNDGAHPMGGVSIDGSGNLYGTTYYAGANNAGTVFEFTVGGAFKTLYSFNGTNNGAHDGANPNACPLPDGNGNLYGTTVNTGQNGYGILWEITASSAYQVLYNFQGTPADGYFPTAGLIFDSSNNLIGTSTGTGGNFGVTNYGDVFRFSFPTPTALSPAAALPGSAQLTLTITGINFVNADKVLWNGADLSATFMDSQHLTAVVPASDLVKAGKANVSVYDPTTNHTSSPLVFTIAFPAITTKLSSISRDTNNNVVVTVTLKNGGPTDANNLSITSATLHGTAAISGTGPVGSLPAGSSVNVTLTFPSSVPSGATQLVVSGSYTGGNFHSTIQVQVP